MLTGAANVSGNLAADLQQQVHRLLGIFEQQVVAELPASGLPAGMVPAMQPCNLMALLDPGKLYIILTHVNAGGIPRIVYVDYRANGACSLQTAAMIAQAQLGYTQVSGFELPGTLLSASDDEKRVALQGVAREYLRSTQQAIERALRVVRFNPIFQARELMLDESLTFMLSPFGQPFDAIFADHIKPTVAKVPNLTCRRADDIYDNHPIMEDVWRNICQARLVIADLSGRNPNVFYEVGIAHTVGKEVVLLTQTMNDVPFDLRHLRCIVYDYTPRGMKSMEDNLLNTINNILAARPPARLV